MAAAVVGVSAGCVPPPQAPSLGGNRIARAGRGVPCCATPPVGVHARAQGGRRAQAGSLLSLLSRPRRVLPEAPLSSPWRSAAHRSPALATHPAVAPSGAAIRCRTSWRRARPWAGLCGAGPRARRGSRRKGFTGRHCLRDGCAPLAPSPPALEGRPPPHLAGQGGHDPARLSGHWAARGAGPHACAVGGASFFDSRC